MVIINFLLVDSLQKTEFPVEEPIAGAESIAGVRGEAVVSVERPSLEKFRAEHFVPRIPAKLTSKSNSLHGNRIETSVKKINHNFHAFITKSIDLDCV